jgi:predicted metal-dependent phosphoesterase TrpH
MNMIIKADMHIHTCLSPCAEISISPKRAAERAYQEGLMMIFITDHNSMQNAEAAMKTAEKYENLKVYPGMEITSREEVHTLALFEYIQDAYAMQYEIYKYLPDIISERESKDQVIANENDEVEGYCSKSLFSAVDKNIDYIVNLIHQHNGLAVAAHIDRPSFSVISQLGFIPETLDYDALEISPITGIEKAKTIYKEYSGKYNFITGSDSHWLDNIGKVYTEFEAKDNSFSSFTSFLKRKVN